LGPKKKIDFTTRIKRSKHLKLKKTNVYCINKFLMFLGLFPMLKEREVAMFVPPINAVVTHARIAARPWRPQAAQGIP
jgi:hypothetical protein